MATQPGASRPRRWPRRLLLGVNIFVAICLVISGVGYAYLKWQFGRVPKISFECTPAQEVLRDCGEDKAGIPMNVLLVGSDARKDISAAEQEQFGTQKDAGGQRSDTILILHADPEAQKAAILSIPRDLAVPIAGRANQRPDRINSAFEKGPDVLIRTLRESLGIEIDHYAEVDFNGFRGVVNAIGGVTLFFDAPARDRVSGLDIRNPGCVKMNGNTALAYVRSRNYQYLEKGKWQTDPTADLGRIQRQQGFIRRVLGKASRAGRNPLTLNALVNTAVNKVTIDKAFSTKDIFRLARQFKSLEPDAVEIFSLPTVGGRIDGKSILRLVEPDATQIIDRFSGKAPPAPTEPPPKVLPGTVRARVLNGSGTSGQAGTAAQGLQKANFGVAGVGSADSFTYRQSEVRYGRGQLAKAELLKAYVDGSAVLKEDLALRGGDLVLVTGADFKGIRDPAGTPAPPSSAPPPAPTAPKPGPGGKAAAPQTSVAPAQAAC
ncbi:MAG TPA: LCP family protein [Acidimicrobiales bacterium]|nr:LCP family protein [Acidimicrobiales bacterium]